MWFPYSRVAYPPKKGKAALIAASKLSSKIDSTGCIDSNEKKSTALFAVFPWIRRFFQFSAVFKEIYQISIITFNISDRIQRFWCRFLCFYIRGVYWNYFCIATCSAKSKMAAILDFLWNSYCKSAINLHKTGQN